MKIIAFILTIVFSILTAVAFALGDTNLLILSIGGVLFNQNEYNSHRYID